jgi:hypothetical protein
MKILYGIIVLILVCSCSTGQNLVRADIEQGKISGQIYAESPDHYFAILLGIENTEKWKIFYTDDIYIYYGRLKNEKTIDILFRQETKSIEKYIPLYKNSNIRMIIMENALNYLKNELIFPDRMEDTIEINYAGIIENDDSIKYQFEVISYYTPSVCFFGPGKQREKILLITDKDLNILERYFIRSFK